MQQIQCSGVFEERSTGVALDVRLERALLLAHLLVQLAGLRVHLGRGQGARDALEELRLEVAVRAALHDLLGLGRPAKMSRVVKTLSGNEQSRP